MKFFCMDLHISVIADFKSANPDIEVVDWCLSGHAWVMGRQQEYPKIINPNTWTSLDETMIRDFQKEYDTFLSSFDGFITGHVMAFAMIYEKYKKPILAINSCRYDMPFCWNKNLKMLDTYNSAIQRMTSSGQLCIVSNNRADQEYTKIGASVYPEYNPSLCLYTNTTYSPTKPTFVCYNGTLPSHPLVSDRPKNYKWSDITSYKGVIHFPYETSLMSMFEHFTAGCPMFLPSKSYWKSNPTLHSITNYWGRSMPRYMKEACKDDFWIESSDIYTLFSKSPNVYFFDSVDMLFELLETFEYKDSSEFHEQHIRNVKEKWDGIMKRLLSNTYRTKYPPHLCYNRLPLLANVVFDGNYANTGVQPQHIYPYHSPLEKGDVVFVKTDYLDWFLKNVPIQVPITLLTGVSDLSPSQSQCETILTNQYIRKWIGCNIPASHLKITKLLIGVGEPERPNGNHETLVRLHKNRIPWNEKQNGICFPYHSNTHESRTFEHMLPKMPFEDYMNEISKYKFVRCMRGNGLDTHRFSEILLMGSVPVIDHSPLDDLYTQFPCLFVDDDISEFVWDESKYRSFIDMFWLR